MDLVDANDVVGFYQFRVKLTYTHSTTPTYQAILFITQIADLNDDFLPVLSGSTFIFKVKLKSRQGVYLKVNAGNPIMPIPGKHKNDGDIELEFRQKIGVVQWNNVNVVLNGSTENITSRTESQVFLKSRRNSINF